MDGISPDITYFTLVIPMYKSMESVALRVGSSWLAFWVLVLFENECTFIYWLDWLKSVQWDNFTNETRFIFGQETRNVSPADKICSLSVLISKQIVKIIILRVNLSVNQFTIYLCV